MKIGLMWFDNSDQKCLSDKIREAAAFYFKKYGKVANCAWVNPKESGESPENIECIKSNSILPFHYWIGVDK